MRDMGCAGETEAADECPLGIHCPCYESGAEDGAEEASYESQESQISAAFSLARGEVERIFKRHLGPIEDKYILADEIWQFKEVETLTALRKEILDALDD